MRWDNGDGTVVLTTTNAIHSGDVGGVAGDGEHGPSVTPGTSLEFQGVVGSTSPDPDSSNNSGNADTSMMRAGDLEHP